MSQIIEISKKSEDIVTIGDINIENIKLYDKRIFYINIVDDNGAFITDDSGEYICR